MKKEKYPGDRLSIITSVNEHSLVMSWINSQSNLMDSLRFLIEQDIINNGVRNINKLVPKERDFKPGEQLEVNKVYNKPQQKIVVTDETSRTIDEIAATKEENTIEQQDEIKVLSTEENKKELNVTDEEINSWNF